MLPALPEEYVDRLAAVEKTWKGPKRHAIQLARYFLRARRQYLLSERKAAAKSYEKASKVPVTDSLLKGFTLTAARWLKVMRNTEAGGGEAGMAIIDAEHDTKHAELRREIAKRPDYKSMDPGKMSTDFVNEHMVVTCRSSATAEMRDKMIASMPKFEGIDVTVSKGCEVKCCDACGKSFPLLVKPMLCGGCKQTSYCDRDCQRRHWKQHRVMCKAFRAAPSGTPPPRTEPEPASEPKSDYLSGTLLTRDGAGHQGAGSTNTALGSAFTTGGEPNTPAQISQLAEILSRSRT